MKTNMKYRLRENTIYNLKAYSNDSNWCIVARRDSIYVTRKGFVHTNDWLLQLYRVDENGKHISQYWKRKDGSKFNKIRYASKENLLSALATFRNGDFSQAYNEAIERGTVYSR